MSILQMKLKASVVLNVLGILLFMITSNITHAQCATINGATGMDNVGNQAFTGRMGMRFNVNSPIIVSQLGAFDSGQDGFNSTISVAIVDTSGTVVVPSSGIPLALFGVIGTYAGPFQMVGGFPPVTLTSGTYTEVAYGYGASEMNGNTNDGDALAITNTGGGLIFHVDSPWDTVAAMGVPSFTHIVGGFHAGNFTFSAVQPRLRTTLNGIVITTNNDTVNDTARVTVCNDNAVNITLGTFSDLSGSVASDHTVKAWMEYSGMNVNFTGVVPANWSFPIGRRLSDYPGYTAILSKININLPATATLRWRAFVDYNLNGQIDAGECPGDWAVYIINFESQAPAVTCPADQEIDLDPEECTENVEYANPTTSDLPCVAPVTLNQTSGLPSGSDFPIGVTTNTFVATDASGNTSTCSFTVTVNDYINPSLGCKLVHFSLDEDCQGELTPTEVLTGWEGPMGEILLGCMDEFTIEVTGPNGENLGNVLSGAYLGKTLNYSITHTNGFSCWNTVLIEDKIAPTITCRDITVNCLEDLDKVTVAYPDDNCNARLVLVNEVHALLDCDDYHIGTVTRTYKAVDDYGNESLPCTATIYLLRSSNMGIVPPPANPKLVCSSVYRVDDRGLGYPHPTVTGVPRFGGRDLWPQRQLDMRFCNALIDYKDDLLIDTDCKKRIRRTWTITEWWCSTSVDIFVGVQMIDIVDDVPPTIPQLPHITVTTQTRSCTAAVQLPTLNITDNCNTIKRVYINANDGNPSGYVNGNGGLMELGVGTHSITYTAIDNCTNSSSMTYRITVKDETDPVAICDQFATVSIKTNGYTDVTATAVDDGSFDECGDVTLKIRRMEDPCNLGHNTAWFDKVGFCCLDANTSRMVQLLVTDKGGNTNICMVSVNVQEKVDPTITCPGDFTIEDCLFTFDPSFSGANNAFGAAVINDNCPSNNTLVHALVDNRTQCGTGNVVRTFSVSQGNTTFQTCTQTIVFENNDPFYINDYDNNDPDDDVIWPKDYLALGQCSFSGLLPETLPDSSSFPKFTEDACDLVGMRYSDLVFPFTTNGACYKIIRTWTIIDWCQKDRNGDHYTWTYEQEIKVIDNNVPVITVPASPVIFETLNCYSDEVTLSATAVDCTPDSNLVWQYEIMHEGDLLTSGNSNSVTDEFEVGEYTITFTVEDRCGNVSQESYDFIVETTKSPTAICKKGLAAPLVLMNTGNGNVLMAMIPAEFFDNKSYHTCDYEFQLSYSSDVDNDTLTFTTPGCKAIELWVTDENGNTSFCETYVDIQLNGVSNNCDGNQLLSTVSGRTSKENNEEIENVIVEMIGSEQDPVTTGASGNYAFAPMINGGAYQIKPNKDGDDLNGVSTLDVVMIQRHILGMQKLNSPYKIIAADANNSGTVTASDLTEIRKLILGNTASFPNNTSWRFVDAGYKFPDPTNPWIGNLAEHYNIDVLNNSMDINFVGIKVGDVNDNAKGSGFNDVNTESRTSKTVSITNRKVMSGEIIEIPVMADNNETLYGLQSQWKANGLIIRDIKSQAIKVGSEDYAINAINNANMSIAAPNGVRTYKDKALFTLEVEVLRNGNLSEMLSLGNDLSSEVYNEVLEPQPITIQWRTDDLAAFALSNITPNPWNAQTQITFDMPVDGMVSFKVKDYTGRKIISAVDQYQAGQNIIQLNRSDIGQPGVYIYELRYEDKVITGKMIMIE